MLRHPAHTHTHTHGETCRGEAVNELGGRPPVRESESGPDIVNRARSGHRAEMTLDRLVADDQLGGDGTVGQSVDHKQQDLASAASAPAGAGPELVALHAAPRCRPPWPPCPGRSRSRRGAQLELTDQLVAADAFQQVSRRADAQRLKQVLLVVVDRQHHDLAVRVALTQLNAQVQAAGTLHAHVAQHDVGVEPSTTLSARSAPTAWPTTSTRSRNAASMALRPSMTISWSSTSTRRTGGLPAIPGSGVPALSPGLRPWAQPAGSHGTTLELAFSRGRGSWHRRSPNWGRPNACDVGHPIRMPTTQEKTWRAGRFWWDAAAPAERQQFRCAR